uniref:MTOR-associated protein MEAK7 n=1 Tax=Callorhinchus milii TaxID=7868 RepID=A0A4W3INT0_CALMI|eukprot:gi/632944312/ref/XP_007887441.1/ PREDICTED: TLD domain-containing protein 1 [Callorhinchus milii]
MGNAESSSLHRFQAKFIPEEQAILDDVFDAMTGSGASDDQKGRKAAKKQVTLDLLRAYTKGTLQESMMVRLYDGMRSMDTAGKSLSWTQNVSKEQFVMFVAYVLQGTAEERSLVVRSMVSSDDSGPVRESQLREFAEELIVSTVQLLESEQLLRGWNLERMGDGAIGAKQLATHLVSQLKPQGEGLQVGALASADYGRAELEDWVYRVPHVSTFLRLVVTMGLRMSKPQAPTELFNVNKQVLPLCKVERWGELLSVLEPPSIIYLNSNLPAELQGRWQLLFSSRAHGESFSRLSGQIVQKGPSLLIIKDSDGHIFGGFASQSWDVKPQFQGDSKCFLFTLSPQLGMYTCTSYNNHYMYLNHGQQTMPNGLGMGGQHNYFGLWIDSDYGTGHSKAKPRCTTYNSPQLSGKENFAIDVLEVWAVGASPKKMNTKTKSILDSDLEAQALLEMINKTRKSEGLRERADDEDDDSS